MPTPTYDSFLSHNSGDKPAVEALARLLKQDGFEVWLDKWHLIPGNPWQEEIEQALSDCATCCVCIDPGEIGPWQNEDMRAAIGRRVGEKQWFRIIPVLVGLWYQGADEAALSREAEHILQSHQPSPKCSEAD